MSGLTDNKVTIAIDCMGGDYAPQSVIDGIHCIDSSLKDKIFFLLCGDEKQIKKYLSKYNDIQNISKIIHTDSFIANEEKPSTAIRKRQSSMYIAINCVKNGEADAVISCGNTGALMAISKLVLKTISGIDRPALIQSIPNLLGKTSVLLDMGANISCDSTNLYQFAIMGYIYSRIVSDNKNPKIGILNVGSEEMKGNDSIKHASVMLKESHLHDNFFGYIEGDDILKGIVDVIVTDGFTGNVALKAIEGASKLFGSILKDGFSHSILSKLGYLLARRGFKTAEKKIDHKKRNGAMFLGLNGIVVKSHGNSDKISFSYAIKNTFDLVINKINDNIIESIQSSDSIHEDINNI